MIHMKQTKALAANRPSLSVIPDLSTLNSSNKSSSCLNYLKSSSKSAERTPTVTPTAFYCLSSRQQPQEEGLIKKALKSLNKHLESPSKNPLTTTSAPSQRLLKRKTLGKTSSQVKIPSPVETILKPAVQSQLKLTKLNDILDENLKVLTNRGETKPKSWLENLVMIKEFSFKSEDFEESLNFCNKIFRDFLVRLKQTGKENEASLIEKIWRLNYETIDSLVESFQLKIKDLQDELNRKNSEVQRVSQQFSFKEGELLKKFEDIMAENQELCGKLIKSQKKNDEFQSKLLRNAKFQGGEWYLDKLTNVEPILSRIGEKLQNLECIFVRNAKTRRFWKEDDDWFLEVDRKVKNKKSLDLVRPDFLDKLEFLNC